MASFSSIGPTMDGRIKPDVVAPGDYVLSAFAGSPQVLDDRLYREKLNAHRDGDGEGDLYDGKDDENCAVHQMSGTSMATAVLAGVAVLVRQFFMDASHWASLCDTRYDSCTRGKGVEPSGVLLKAVLLHSGEPIKQYSDSILDPTAYIRSFTLESPPDVYQGE